MSPISRALTLGAALALGTAAASSAMATPVSSLTATEYTLTTSNPDVQHGIDGHTVLGLVKGTLGPDGLPVVNGTYGGASGPITDINAGGELQWWTPHSGSNGTVLVTAQGGPATVSLPFSSNLFPNGKNDGADGYTSARLDGTFSLANAGSVTLNLGSDDDAWVFIDGALVDDNGGVHTDVVAPTTTATLAAGTHSLDLFFADRHTTGAELSFNANVQLAPVPTSVPEPAAFAVLGVGLVGLALARRWRA